MTTAPSVLITGSSSGIGRELAEGLARQGATVFASMRDLGGRNATIAAELRQIAARDQLALHPVELDVGSDESVAQAVAAVIDAAGRIDVVINNAGLGMAGLIEATTLEQAEQVFNTNVFGVLRINQAVLPHLRRQGSGLLIYTSSTVSQILVPFLGVYSASKAAMEALALSQHFEVFRLGIDTVLLQLGGYTTNFGVNMQAAARNELDAEYGEVSKVAQGFVGGFANIMTTYPHPQEVVDLVARLIALPAGERPLRIPIGLGSDGLVPLNELTAAKQQQMLEWINLGLLVER